MQVEPRKLPSENLDLHTKFVIPRPVVVPGSMLDMYSTHSPKVPSKLTMERMYSMDSTLKAESNIPHVSSPKRTGTMLQSMFNAINGIWEHFSKGPGSFMANVNNPLSVTVVQNEGIISHEFFKSLTVRKESLPTDNTYMHDVEKKETLGIIEQVCTFDQKNLSPTNIFSDSLNQKFDIQEPMKVDTVCPESNIHDLIIKKYAGDSTRLEKLRVTVTDGESLFHNCQENALNNRIDQSSCPDNFTKEISELRNSCGVKSIDDNILSKSMSCESLNSTADCTLHTDPTHTESKTTANCRGDCIISPGERVIGKLLTNVWQKVVGVTDRLNFRMDPMEPEMAGKRSVSPNKRRKLNTVAKGRGRGRAKPQLRRSGVSQTRHRKERTKHDLEVDIHDDFDIYQDSEIVRILQGTLPTDSCNFEDEGIDVPDCAIATVSAIHKPAAFTLGDIKPRCRKPKTRKSVNQDACKFVTSVRYVPDRTMDFDHDYYDNNYDSQKNTYRPRLISESSVDSEDSYCIIFDTESDLEIQADSGLPDENYDSEDTTEDEDEDDDTDEESISSTQKVKFNLNPTVHVMVQWDYAYRAARRGPWEQMARDRDRFKGRIHCIERILKPILSTQHRSHIWQERFALDD